LINYVFFIDHTAYCVGKVSTGHTVQRDLSHSDLALKRF
jgi:hypothetical protein